MKTIELNGYKIPMSKRETEFNQWLDTGSDNWMEAYNIYPHRRNKGVKTDPRFISSWFNSTLKGLRKKGLCRDIPFVRVYGSGGYIEVVKWINPRRKGSKANFIAQTVEDTNRNTLKELHKII